VWESCKLPSEVRGGVSAENAFACILGSEIAAGGDDFPLCSSEINVYK